MTDYGIDISHWNRVADWRAVRGNNITYASIKVTESTDFIDDAATGHTAGARGAGICAGGYHFARTTPVDRQVDHFVAQLNARGLLAAGSLAPMLDMEAAELRGDANPFVSRFITRFREITGRRTVLVYANLDWWRNVLRPNEWADQDVFLWIARYNGDPGNPGWAHPRLALHQHTNKGSVTGIPATSTATPPSADTRWTTSPSPQAAHPPRRHRHRPRRTPTSCDRATRSRRSPPSTAPPGRNSSGSTASRTRTRSTPARC